MAYDSIPQELKELRNWVCRKGKIPYSPDGRNAKSNDSSTWSNYSECEKAAVSGIFDGIGFQFGNSPYVGIDIDHCVDPVTAQLSDVAAEIIKKLDSYTEYSPSGTGIHIICKGELPAEGNKNPAIGVEMYSTDRYFTVTGNVLHNQPIRESSTLKEIHAKYIAKPKTDKPKVKQQKRHISITENELIEKIRNNERQGAEFHKLFDLGDTGGDWSSADLSLCNMLAFWTACNAEMMDSIFRISGLMRPKWDRATAGTTYGDMTIQKAINDCTEIYDPEYNKISPDVAFGWDGKPETKPREVKKEKKVEPLKIYTAEELEAMDLKPPDFIVADFLPCGVSVLAAPSKMGKSWLCLDLALSVSQGESFLGFMTLKNDVLYLALEDSLYRLNDRISKLLNGRKRPKGFKTSIKSERLDTGLIEQLDTILSGNPLLKLIIIDTFQMIKPPSERSKTAYEMDYQHLGKLRELTTKYNICILLVHHTRKSTGFQEDPFESILGSTAMQGATDFMVVIKKQKVDDDVATMSYKGRDVSYEALCIEFNKDSCKWINEGSARDIESMRREMEYRNNPIVRTIKAKLEDMEEDSTELIKEYVVRPTDLREAIINFTGEVVGGNGKACMNEAKKYFYLMEKLDKIRCIPPEENTTYRNKKGFFYRFKKIS